MKAPILFAFAGAFLLVGGVAIATQGHPIQAMGDLFESDGEECDDGADDANESASGDGDGETDDDAACAPASA